MLGHGNDIRLGADVDLDAHVELGFVADLGDAAVMFEQASIDPLFYQSQFGIARLRFLRRHERLFLMGHQGKNTGGVGVLRGDDFTAAAAGQCCAVAAQVESTFGFVGVVTVEALIFEKGKDVIAKRHFLAISFFVLGGKSSGIAEKSAGGEGGATGGGAK